MTARGPLFPSMPVCERIGASLEGRKLSGGAHELLGWTLYESGPENADHTVLLLPGGLCSAAFYDDLLAEPLLQEPSIRFVATTPPGHAGTSPPEDVSVESYAGRPRRSRPNSAAMPLSVTASAPTSPSRWWFQASSQAR